MNSVFAMGTFFTPSTIERGGRRGIMLWSSVALTVFMLIFVVMINLGDKINDATQWTAVASVCAYIFVFGYGWVGIPWLYGPEVRTAHTHTRTHPYIYTSRWSNLLTLIYIDRTTSLPTLGRVLRRHWRVVNDIRHRLRRWYRHRESRTQDLDLVLGLL